jgi:hypothetical protein
MNDEKEREKADMTELLLSKLNGKSVLSLSFAPETVETSAMGIG